MKIYVPTEITTEAEAEALPDGTHVVTLYDGVQEAPLIFVKLNGMFFDWSGDTFLHPSEIVPITALVAQEVEEHTEKRRGWLVRSLGGVNLQLPYQGRPGDSLTDSEEPQEYTLTRWTTDWEEA